MQLRGLHHLTAISADARGNHACYTGVMGMRLVKKTVNQDDTSAYHLFYADAEGRPGTDLTFFDWPTTRERRGAGSVVRTGLRVAGRQALAWWRSHLTEHGIACTPVAEDGRQGLALADPEGQRLLLIDDGGAGDARPWSGSPVPPGHQIRGLGPVTMSVREIAGTEAFLTDVMGMAQARTFRAADGCETVVFAMGEGGPGAELRQDRRPHVELDAVTLAVVEAHRLDVGVSIERPGQAGGGILTAREEHDGLGGVLSGHHAIPRNLWVCSPSRQRGCAMQ